MSYGKSFTPTYPSRRRPYRYNPHPGNFRTYYTANSDSYRPQYTPPNQTYMPYRSQIQNSTSRPLQAQKEERSTRKNAYPNVNCGRNKTIQRKSYYQKPFTNKN